MLSYPMTRQWTRLHPLLVFSSELSTLALERSRISSVSGQSKRPSLALGETPGRWLNSTEVDQHCNTT